MIILDMNQISLANLMMNFHMNKSTELEEDMVRHMILNSIRMYRTMFKDEYGEIVLAYDSKHYWSCLLYTSPSPRDRQKSRMPSSA